MSAAGNIHPAMVSPGTKAAIRRCVPPIASVCEPEGHADITAAALSCHHVDALEAVLRDDGVDAVVFITVATLFLDLPEMAGALLERLASPSVRGREQARFPGDPFRYVGDAMPAHSRRRRASHLGHAGTSRSRPFPDDGENQLGETRGSMRVLDEYSARQYLQGRGPRLARAILAHSKPEAIDAAKRIGWPVV